MGLGSYIYIYVLRVGGCCPAGWREFMRQTRGGKKKKDSPPFFIPVGASSPEGNFYRSFHSYRNPNRSIILYILINWMVNDLKKIHELIRSHHTKKGKKHEKKSWQLGGNPTLTHIYRSHVFFSYLLRKKKWITIYITLSVWLGITVQQHIIREPISGPFCQRAFILFYDVSPPIKNKKNKPSRIHIYIFFPPLIYNVRIRQHRCCAKMLSCVSPSPPPAAPHLSDKEKGGKRENQLCKCAAIQRERKAFSFSLKTWRRHQNAEGRPRAGKQLIAARKRGPLMYKIARRTIVILCAQFSRAFIMTPKKDLKEFTLIYLCYCENKIK